MQAFFEAWYGQVITAIVAVLLILVGIGIVAGKKKNRRQATRMLVFSAAAIALATVLSFLKIVELPQGGSIACKNRLSASFTYCILALKFSSLLSVINLAKRLM